MTARLGNRAVWIAGMLALIGCLLPQNTSAGLVDELDSYPPRWRLVDNDCDAQLLKHENQPRGGFDGGPCETITVRMGQGSSAWLAYPIELVRPLDDLVARVWVSAGEPIRVGFRLRYPYIQDPQTKRPVNVMVDGAILRETGQWGRLGIGAVEKSVKKATISVRNRFGGSADVRDVMIDAVLLEIYTGPSTQSISIDRLVVDGMVPITQKVADGQTSRRVSANDSNTSLPPSDTSHAFPVGRVTRVLQYNGEPLAWVRSLGFDAIWLTRPADSSVLGEAMQHNLKIYAPPPPVIDPNLEAMLEPIAAWVLDSAPEVPLADHAVGSVAAEKQTLDYEILDDLSIDRVAKHIRRIRGLPTRWQRPVIAAPRESFREYARHLDGLVYDLPPRVRGISPAEETTESSAAASLASGRMQYAIGVDTLPPATLIDQAERMATAKGASMPSTPAWQSIWAQVFSHLPEAPSAVFYRSHRSLTSDPIYDTGRSTGLSYINRMMAMIEPWVATANASPTMLGTANGPWNPNRLIQTSGAIAYHQGEFKNESSHWWVATSRVPAAPGADGSGSGRNSIVAGDGGEIVIPLASEFGASQVWRLTHFAAERLPVEETPNGPVVRIVSPDVVEIVVQSSDASVAAKLAQAAARFSRQAVSDRWELAEQALGQTQNAWQIAGATGAIGASPPALLNAAAETLELARPAFYANDFLAAIHAARRTDAWVLRSRDQLAKQLSMDQPRHFSSPTLDVGGLETHGLIRSIRDTLDEARTETWSRNLITTGSLDDARALGPGRWSFGNRLDRTVESQITHLKARTYAGSGALRATAVAKTAVARGAMPARIGGGYGGTVMQIRSPSVRVRRDTEIRIDAMIRTIGFSRPHQGVLVYHSIGGQAAGVLVRDATDWTPVRLHRHSLDDSEVSVYFEVLGDGEVMIDEVSLKVREIATPTMPLRPLVSEVQDDRAR